MLLRYQGEKSQPCEQIKLRFVEGQPVSVATKAFLEWSCEKIEELRKKTLLLIWDNATWHKSQAVEKWIWEHNQQVKKERQGVRIVSCLLPKKSPWLNPIEPHWVHGKRQIVEPDKVLTVQEVIDRVYGYFGLPSQGYLTLPEFVT